MPVSTDEIVKKARELGDLISQHPSAKKIEDVLRRLEADTDAQRAMNDYNRFLQTLAQKEEQGQPIEVEDKRKLEQLQGAVVRNAVLRDFQVAQMDYLDLMRQVDEAMQAGPAGQAQQPAPAAAPLVNPDFASFT